MFNFYYEKQGILCVDNNFPLQNYLAGSLGIISAVAPHLFIYKYNLKKD
tara:strand:- start:8724 stop:8870 length:147 start_codon:yes stop_codon:yes gene_type:complete